MAINTADYITLSALVYASLRGHTHKTVGELISDGVLDEESDLKKPEFSALKNTSSRLRQYTLLDFKADPFTGFAAAAFRSSSGEIVFSFRGTEDFGDLITDLQIALSFSDRLIPQFQLAKDFVYNTLNEHGPICYATQDEMFDSLGHHSNISFTGHSLGGGLAQCLSNLFIKRRGLRV